MRKRPEVIAARATQRIATLREAAGTVDRLLFHDGPELLDLETTPAHVKQRILDDVDRIARLLLVQRLWRRRIGQLILEARRTRHGRPVRVLDVGSGAGGLLFQLEDWARQKRIPVQLIGLDNNPEGVATARRKAEEEGRHVDFDLGDARQLVDFADGSVDVAVSTFVLHHLPAGEAAQSLAELDRVAAVNFFAFDLRRSAAALPALWAFLRMARFDAPTRHDSVVSLRRGYAVAEVEALLDAAEIANFHVEPVLPAFLIATRA